MVYPDEKNRSAALSVKWPATKRVFRSEKPVSRYYVLTSIPVAIYDKVLRKVGITLRYNSIIPDNFNRLLTPLFLARFHDSV